MPISSGADASGTALPFPATLKPDDESAVSLSSCLAGEERVGDGGGKARDGSRAMGRRDRGVEGELTLLL